MKSLVMLMRKLQLEQKKILKIGIFLFAFFLNTRHVFAENSNANVEARDLSAQNDSFSNEQTKLAKFKKAARKLLLSRLLNSENKSVRIRILPPMDYTSLQTPNVVTETIQRGIRMYDENLNVEIAEYKMKSLTLEQFRDAVTKLNTDLLFVTVMHASNFDMYLYDRRMPYQIYAHSEPIATSAQYDLTAEVAAYYSKLLVRRTLYRFIKNQAYELPRDESPPLLKLEIPRFIASKESLDFINSESTNSFMAQVGLGSSLSRGENGKMWNSSILSVQAGYKVMDRTFVKLGFEMAAYNAILGGISYNFMGKDKLFKTELGLSLAHAITSKTLDWDRTNGIDGGSMHVVPSAAVIVPLMDVSFRVDTQLFIGIKEKTMMLNVIPGIGISF